MEQTLDQLRAIYSRTRKPVHVAVLAKKLKASHPAVSARLNCLKRKDLVRNDGNKGWVPADELPKGWDADKPVWQRVTRIVRRKYKLLLERTP